MKLRSYMKYVSALINSQFAEVQDRGWFFFINCIILDPKFE